MNKPPPGPEFQPEDVDRLISKFNRQADPEKRRSLDEALTGEKERFNEQERSREAQTRSPERDR